MNIIDFIPFGHENAVGRKYLSSMTGLSDRKVRDMIENESNREHPILNLQDGKGYFQPSEKEAYLVRIYIAQESRRMRKISHKVGEINKYLKKSGNELERNQINIFDYIGGDSP